MPQTPSGEPGSSATGGATMIPAEATSGLFGKYALLFGADIASRGLRFFTDIVLVRHFGPAVFGHINVAQSLAVQGMSIANGGLDTAGMRDVAAMPDATQSIAATVVVLRLAMGLVAWSALAGLTWTIPQYRESFELAALFGLSMFTGALTLGWVAQGRGWVNSVALSMLAVNLMYFAGIQAAAFFHWPPWSVPIILTAGELLTASGLWIWIVRKAGAITRPLPMAEMLAFLWGSLPIGGANILRGFVLASDVLLLGLFAGKGEVGFYSGAFKLYSLGLSLIALYFTILLPHLASHAADAKVSIRTRLYWALRRALLAAVPITLAGVLLARFVLLLLFGAGFEEAVPVLQILIVALVPHLAAGHFRTALVALGLQRLDLRLVGVAAVVHAAAKMLLIPLLGMTGAAWGTLTGEVALLVVVWQAARGAFSAEGAIDDLSRP